MGNILLIAKKELNDLLSNRMVLVVLIGFFATVIFSVYDLYDILNRGLMPQMQYGDSVGMVFACYLLNTLSMNYGPAVGIMIGCASISSERHQNALSTLLVKPLYRDTIINGKLMGSLAFIALVIGITTAIYTSVLFILCGNAFAPTLGDYFSRLPLVLLLSMIIVSIFLSVSVLISLMVRNQAFAMILSVIVLYISSFAQTEGFSGVLCNMLPEYGDFIHKWIINSAPTGFLVAMKNNLFNSSITAIDSLVLVIPDIAKFSLFAIIACILSYIVFVRSDRA